MASTAPEASPPPLKDALDSRGFLSLVNHGEYDLDAALLGAASTSASGSATGDDASWMEQWVMATGVAMFQCEWSYTKTKNEIELVVEQIVPEWRGDDLGAHRGSFEGLLLIRVFEVDDLVMVSATTAHPPFF